MSEEAFTMERGNWYALTMYPGYADIPYYSPLRVDAIDRLSECHFTMDFLNLAYARGVQNFSFTFEVLKAERDFLACSPTDQTDRMYVFAQLTRGWMETCFPDIEREGLFDDAGKPVGRAFLALN